MGVCARWMKRAAFALASVTPLLACGQDPLEPPSPPVPSNDLELPTPAFAFGDRDHPVVVEELEALLSSPGRVRGLRHALERRDARHGDDVDRVLADADLPAELAAIPLVECHYANIVEIVDPDDPPQRDLAAGLWMFMPPTARRYGLVVNDERDDRLDPRRATRAAARYLHDLYEEFGDWRLVLAAYNTGAGRVRSVIARHGTDDAWELIARGALNDYAARVAAASLVLENPDLLAM